MKITDNYNLTHLFITKDVNLFIEDGQKIQTLLIHLQPVKQFFLSRNWNIAYQLITSDRYKELLHLQKDANVTPLQGCVILLTDLGKYPQFREVYNILREQLPLVIEGFQIRDKQFFSNDVSITEEIWNYIIYLLKLSYGEKAEKPLSLDSPEARKFWEAQKALDARIAKVKATKEGDADAMMKIMLSIIYAFPSLTFDYLFDQTMAQIQWLQKYAAKSMSYEVNAKAFAAGNMKKGQKLDFFIK